NRIEGCYAYNPLDDTVKRKDVGRYNEKTRNERRTLLHNIKNYAMCSKYTLDECEKLFSSLKDILGIANNLLRRLEETALRDKHDYVLKSANEYYNEGVKSDGCDDLVRQSRCMIMNALNLVLGNRYVYMMYYNKGKDGYFYKVDNLYGCKDVYLLYGILNDIKSILGLEVNGFYTYVTFKYIKDKEEKEKLEKERELERVRREEERRKAELEKEEKKRKEDEEGQKMYDEIKELIKIRTYSRSDKWVKEVLNIVENNRAYSSLTDSQKSRVKVVLEKLRNDEYKGYSYLGDDEELAKKVEVLKGATGSELELGGITFFEWGVIETVSERGRASEKQLKYIESAYKKLMKVRGVN
ncbi:MAG: hypothetical protein QXD03_05475, partial [Candidatus Anstonellales archaeon]